MQLRISKSSIAALGAMAVLAMFFVMSTFAHAEAAPNVINQIQNSSNSPVSSALVGTSVHDVVQIASSTASTTPQGTVDFAVYANTTCSGSPSSSQNGVALVNGFATSSSSLVTASGLSYKVHYSGDVNNIATDSTCASVTAMSNTSAISTTLSTTSILVGTSVHQSATLSNVTSSATGTVAYTVYSNSSCTTPVQGAGVRTVSNGVVADSDNSTFNTPGTYYWQAVYSGDQNNSSATSTCANGILTVAAAQTQTKNSPTLSTTLSSTSIQVGTSVTDSSVLSGATSNATGTVTYKVFSNNSCTTLWANAGSQTVTNGVVPASAPVLFNIAGTFYWQATYSGDQHNNAATSSCANEVLTVSAIGTTPPPVSTTTNSISGQVYNDLNKNGHKDAGETGLAGFKINLYNSANFNGGTYDPVYKTTTTDANGNYAFNSLTDGTYSVEQLKKTGWKQNSDDYPSVAVSGGVGKSAIDFADVVKKNKNDGKDNGKHKRDCSDAEDREHASTSTPPTSTSTRGWFKFDGNKGHHLGWYIGKGNSGKSHDKKD